MTYKIIASGSKGNALTINSTILVDCGVPFTKIKDCYKGLQVVLLTHIHGDHFNKATIRKLSKERPSLRFACGEWMAKSLISSEVKPKNIDVLDMDTRYSYGQFSVEPFALVHNVVNCGYKVFTEQGNLIYATDTNSMDNVIAKDYDLYLIEANYDEMDMVERISKKQEAGDYVYEFDVLKNHLSKQKCDRFLEKNMGINSKFIYMHQH